MNDFLLLATVLLISGVIAVPLATRFGLGSVLGYLIAGIAISPILGFLHVDITSLQHFAEFGVVMMLFLVGLELEPRKLWSMRNKLIGLGGLQVVGNKPNHQARSQLGVRSAPPLTPQGPLPSRHHPPNPISSV